MAVVTRVIPLLPQSFAIVTAERDWRVTALVVRGENLRVHIGDTVNESCLLLREPEYTLSANILLAQGFHLIFENENFDQRQSAFFCAEEI